MCQIRSKQRQPQASRSQGSSPSKTTPSSSTRAAFTAFTLSPGTRKIIQQQRGQTPSKTKKKRSLQRANSTVDRILQYQELGKDVPLDIAIKRVLVLAQRGDWTGCEQALRLDFRVLLSPFTHSPFPLLCYKSCRKSRATASSTDQLGRSHFRQYTVDVCGNGEQSCADGTFNYARLFG